MKLSSKVPTAVAGALIGFSIALVPGAGAVTQSNQAAAPRSATVTATVLPQAVSQTPVAWTPNVSGGSTVGTGVCNTTYFGSAFHCRSEVYDTAYVDGEVVAVGAFTKVCKPGTLKEGLCAPGTQVTRNDIFAYQASTGAIDPDFVPVVNSGPVWTVVAGPAGSNTVYIGGGFTTVNGQPHGGLAELYVNPGVTTGTSADGSLVTGFRAHTDNFVHSLALSPDGSALYVGGQFSGIDGVTSFPNGEKVGGLARVASSTGALDTTFEVSPADPVSGTPLQTEAMALSPDGSELAFSGSFQTVDGVSHPRAAIVNTGGSYGHPAALADWTAPIFANNCSAEHDYVRGLAFSPDGSFIVTADTGYQSGGQTPYSACDAAARFDVTPASTTTTGTAVDVAPSWIDYTGGDSFYSVAIAGGIVYLGGHARWGNNYCGVNYACAPNTVLVMGLAAIDTNTGMALPWWHPLTLRGAGTMYLSTFPPNTYDGSHSGLIIGTDVDLIAGQYHSENAIFPEYGKSSLVTGGPIPSGIYDENGGTASGPSQCLDGPPSSLGTVDVSTCLNDPEQNWVLPGNGTIKLDGKCLDTSGGVTTSGSGLALDTCSGAATQQWQQGSGNELINTGASTAEGTSVCLTDGGTSGGATPTLTIEACNGSSTQDWPLPAAPPAPTEAPSGSLYSQINQTSTQPACLDDAGDAHTDGNTVHFETCVGNAEQDWVVESNGTIELGTTNECLDVGSTNSTVINTCDGTSTQQWTEEANQQLLNSGTGLCLTVPDAPGTTNPSTNNGIQPVLEQCESGAPGGSQIWWLPTN